MLLGLVVFILISYFDKEIHHFARFITPFTKTALLNPGLCKECKDVI